jgi:hypothetical protein
MTGGVVDDPEKAVKSMKALVARIAQFEGVGLFERAGFKVEGEFLSHKVGAAGDIGHAASVAELAKQFDRVISDDVALWYMRTHTLLGTAAELEERLARLQQSGLAGVYVIAQESSTLPNALIDTLGSALLRVRAGR